MKKKNVCNAESEACSNWINWSPYRTLFCSAFQVKLRPCCCFLIPTPEKTLSVETDWNFKQGQALNYKAKLLTLNQLWIPYSPNLLYFPIYCFLTNVITQHLSKPLMSFVKDKPLSTSLNEKEIAHITFLVRFVSKMVSINVFKNAFCGHFWLVSTKS